MTRFPALFACALLVSLQGCGDDGEVGFPTTDSGADTADVGDGGTGNVAESCDPDPCVFGVCDDTSGAAVCTCEFGWAGAACDSPSGVEDACAQGPCANGACVNEPDGFRCDCDYGFGGTQCDQVIDVEDFCANSPCGEHGDCVNTNAGPTCDCHWGWGGASCDQEIDACEPNPCQNGTCNPTREGPVCVCFAGWDGPLCNARLDDGLCRGVECGNGRCRATLQGAVCECESGWGGADCLAEVVDPCLDAPCNNGFCSADAFGGFECSCFEGFEGESCETLTDGAVPNPVLRLNDCAIELPSPGGWEDNGDGSRTAVTRVALNAGDTVIVLEGRGITYNETTREFSGFLNRIPAMGYLAIAGAIFNTPDELVIEARVLNGDQIREQAGREIPIPAAHEAIAITVSTEGTSVDVPFLDETIDFPEMNLIGVYLDPCDPMGVVSINPATQGMMIAKVEGFGGSFGGNLEMTSRVELWAGETLDGVPVTETRTISGHIYTAGSLSLKPFKIPVRVAVERLTNTDPDGNGEFLEHHLSRLLAGDFPEEPIPPEVDDYQMLLQGDVRPAIPLSGVVESALSELSTFLGYDEISLDLGEGSALFEVTDDRPLGFYFRGVTDTDIFEGTPLDPFTTGVGTDLMGYIRGPLDFGFAYSIDQPLGGGASSVSEVLFVVRPSGPEIRIKRAIDLATIDLSRIDFVPVDTIDLGEVGIEFRVDVTAGTVCGETGYTGDGFECTIEVCVDAEANISATPTCRLPSYAPCFTDDMCISGSCSSAIPDSACVDACDAVRGTCEPRCDATRDVCEDACDGANFACESACRSGDPTCAARCAVDGAACAGCDTAEASCRTLECDVTYGTCTSGCFADKLACTTFECGPEAAACVGECVAETGICGATCSYNDLRCRADRCIAGPESCAATCADTVATCVGDCVVSAGCDALRTSCRVGCDVCITFPELCPEGRNACLNECDASFSACAGDCASSCPLETECLNSCLDCNSECATETAECFSGCGDFCEDLCIPVECEARCSSAQGACESSCGSSQDSCYGGCAGARSSCQAANCGSSAATCLEDCGDCEAACPPPTVCYEETCGPPCGTACDLERDFCLLACESVTACE